MKRLGLIALLSAAAVLRATALPADRVRESSLREAVAVRPEDADARVLECELRGQLQRLAVLVDTASGGKSRLMIDRTKSANPSGGAFRLAGWGSVPTAQVCPVSQRFTAKLGDLGTGTVMEALTLLETSGQGTYLIFVVDEVVRRKGPDAPAPARVVSVMVDDGGRVVFAKHGEAQRLAQPFSTVGELPVADVAFSGQDLQIRMRWDGETFHFRYRPSLIFK